MSFKAVKFNTQSQSEFFKELRSRVDEYFKENNITKYANAKMKFKTGFMIVLYFVPLIIMLIGMVNTIYLNYVLWTLMGFGMSGIGLSIMHDANHGSYSKKKWVNKTLGFLLNFLGGYHKNWIIQHNVLHHSYTNIDGYDEDIKTPFIRLSPNQKVKKMHRYQMYYAPFFYAIMSLYWYVSKDYEQLVRYNKRGLLSGQGISFSKALWQIIIHKIWYIVLTLILPIMLIDLPWWHVLLGFLIMHFITGLALALIFQPAHVVEETVFPKPDKNSSIDNNWAIHQMQTTSNFADKSRFFSWFIGGLNYQVEHHLFPKICHIHYKKISKIVKETASDFNITYNKHKTFFGALKSHFTMLNRLGTDKKLIKA
ncbi:MAG: acyl-CoA desaturase [Bacteroidota bacterium]